MLEIGVTAALTAAAANWRILRRTSRRKAEGCPAPAENTVAAGIARGVVDETDDAAGHRIYLDPWRARGTDGQDQSG